MIVRQLRIVYSPVVHDAPGGGPIIRSAKDAAVVLFDRLRDEPVAVFAALCLTVRGDLIGYHEISRGSLNASIVHPREVFKAAVLTNAAAIILSHNHPSGDPAPSPEDTIITRRLCEAGQLMGIEVLDHIVIGQQGRFYSYRESGTLLAAQPQGGVYDRQDHFERQG